MGARTVKASVVEGMVSLLGNNGGVSNFVFGADLTRHAATNVSSKMMVNCVLEATHSRGCIFHAFAMRRKTRNRSFITASSFGKLPRVFALLQSYRYRVSQLSAPKQKLAGAPE
jgi:hypothetical protein